MDLNEFERYLAEMRMYASMAKANAEKARDIIAKDSSSENKIGIAICYMTKSISDMSIAKIIYYSHYEDFERYDIEEAFTAYDALCYEFMENSATDYSHQWTLTMFDKFIDKYEDSEIKPR